MTQPVAFPLLQEFFFGSADAVEISPTNAGLPQLILLFSCFESESNHEEATDLSSVNKLRSDLDGEQTVPQANPTVKVS